MCDKLGVPHWSPNLLRRWHLTEVRDRYGLDAAQARGSHARADTTEIYAAAADEKARQVAREMG
jgi:hypothetical protein